MCSEDTARRALKALRDAELIVAEPRSGRSTRYALVVEHIERVPDAPHRRCGGT
jgi:DNA-binding transcriptional ArsR family regulator